MLKLDTHISAFARNKWKKEIGQESQDWNWLWLEIVIRIWEVLGSILDPYTDCSDLNDRSFAESLQ